jgi:hypothetical protein|nr:MAG TPA: hypothetical protein [Caudoviricetes sp.]
MEEDDIKFALRNLAAANLSLCDQLIALNASPTMIAQNGLGGIIVDAESVDEYINRIAEENERIKLGIARLKELDLDMTYNCNIYFFSQVRGVVRTSPRKLLDIDNLYDGGHIVADIVADIDQIIPEILLPLLRDSLKASDINLCNRINDAIGEVLTMLDIQKDNEN